MFRAPRAHKYSVSLTAAAASWGTATVISKRAVDEIEPLTLLPIELAVSVGVLAAAVHLSGGGVGWSFELRRHGLLGILNPGLSYALSLAGLAHTTASTSVLLWAVEPVLILAVAFWFFKERISRGLAACAAIALGGVVLVVMQSGTEATPLGAALTLAGVAACAVYTVLAGRFLAHTSSLHAVIVQQAAAFLFSLVLFGGFAIMTDPRPVSDVSATAWLSAVCAGVLYYAVAFWFYVTGLRGVGPAAAGIFINLVPVFGIASSYAFLHERLTGRQWIGVGLIVGAVAIIAKRQSLTTTSRSPDRI